MFHTKISLCTLEVRASHAVIVALEAKLLFPFSSIMKSTVKKTKTKHVVIVLIENVLLNS